MYLGGLRQTYNRKLRPIYLTSPLHHPIPSRPHPLRQARHESKRARKLQVKAERLQERIHARLQLMTDGGQRLPRLERLSSALGLAPFEKNVVVAMIGQAIAPRSMGLMSGGGGGGGGGGGNSPSKTMQVEVLLRCFSSSLQQQIKNR